MRVKTRFKFWKRLRVNRRTLLFVVGYCLVISMTILSCSTNTPPPQAASSSSTPVSSEKQVVRIVREKQLTALAVLEKQGNLEKRLEPLGFAVQWLEFAF